MSAPEPGSLHGPEPHPHPSNGPGDRRAGDDLPVDPDVEVEEGVEQPHRPLHLTPSMVLLVAVGGAIGTATRALVTAAGARSHISAEPATLMINVAGCFVLGLLLESLVRRGPDHGLRRSLRLLVGTGFCGGLTTYSTLGLLVAERARAAEVLTGIEYAAVSLVLGLAAVTLGILLGVVLVRRRPEPPS